MPNIFTIPLPTDEEPHSVQRTVLGGVPFRLEFNWNGRARRWNLSIYTDDGQPIIKGVRLVANFNLLRHVTNQQGPQGVIILSRNVRDDLDSLEGINNSRLWFIDFNGD